MDADEESSPARVPCRYCGDVHPASFSHCPKTGQSLHAGQALVGRVIAGRYRVLALLGEGGMGAVYVAEHLLIGRKVALKRLHPELVGDEKAVKRFQREARAAASTGHEHIVEVLDLGFGEDGAPFLVMEYLRGKSLAQVLRAEGRLEPRRAGRVVGQLLAALAAVHQRGIVHRDLKPDNVLLTNRRGDPDFVKVVDFGISKMQHDDGEALALTRTGVMMGTPFYMSPEQARGLKELDHRVDLYAAGVILYECLTGRLPFDGANYHQLLSAILVGKHPRARELRPEITPALDELVERTLAPDPSARYATARQMLLALVPHGAIDPGTSESVPPPAQARSLDDAKTTPLDRITLDLPTIGVHGPTELASSTESVAPQATPKAPRRAALVDEPTPPNATPFVRRALRSPIPPEPTTQSAPRGRMPAPRGLAPAPRSIGGSPRRFIAQSSDWNEKAATADRPTDTRVREQPPPYSAEPPRRRDDAPLAPEASRPSRVKGALVLSAIDVLRSQPAELERVLARVDPAVAAELARVILPMGWLPLGAYVELLQAAERELGATDEMLALRIGRATADRELTTTHRLFMQSASPAMAVERIPQVFKSYHAPGRVTVERGAAGSYRVEAHELTPDAFSHALAMSGFYQRMLELAGAQDVRVAVTACRERGDDATVTTLRWR